MHSGRVLGGKKFLIISGTGKRGRGLVTLVNSLGLRAVHELVGLILSGVAEREPY